jgi:uncharacterized protein (DUF2062 family)
MAREFFRRLLPSPGAVRSNRFVRWLGPWLQHPALWHVDRRGIAMGFAIGLFFGLLIPVAQILFAVVFAVVLRANLPVAIVSTLVTNPFTFAPIYFLAYRLGAMLLGEAPAPISEADLDTDIDTTVSGVVDYVRFLLDKVAVLGEPLLLGLVVLATSAALLGYALIMLLWRLNVAARWRQRNGRRRS